MSTHEPGQAADARAQALKARAEARRAEAAAARLQAQGYAQTAQACRERAAALWNVEKADKALAQAEEDPTAAALAQKDGERAGKFAVILEGEAARHDQESARASAEAERAEAEAATAYTKAQMGQLRR